MFFQENNSLDFHDLIKKRTKRTAFIIGTAAILFAVIRIVLTRFYVDPDIHFYIADSDLLIRLFDYTAGAGIIALYLISAFLYKYKKDEHVYPAESACFVQGTQTQVFSSAVAGLSLVTSAVLQIWSLFVNNQVPISEILTDFVRNNTFDFLIFFASILSAVYFFITAALNQDTEENSTEYSQMHIIMSLMPVLWSFLHTFKCFFDMSRSVNSPVRIYELLCFLTLSAYFVSESRMIVGRRGASRFFTFAYIAVIFVLLSALPNLILSSFWIMQTNSMQVLYAVQLALAIYITARIYSQIKYGKFQLEL